MKTIGAGTAMLFLSLLLSADAYGAPSSASTQTVAGGGVTAKATYLNPKESDEPRFQIVLDTHSVNLDAYDLKAMSVLRDETGNSYAPTAVEYKGSGHHREAILVFASTARSAKKIELLIKDLAGMKERVFTWAANEH